MSDNKKKYEYFEMLVKYNLFFNYLNCDCLVRVSEDVICQIDCLIKNLCLKCHNINNEDEFLYEVINTCAIVLMKQPFSDGNCRTAKTLMKYLLCLYYGNLMSESIDFFLPVFYSEDDKCDLKDVYELKRKITG